MDSNQSLTERKKIKDSDGKFNEPNDYCSYLWDKSEVLQRKLAQIKICVHVVSSSMYTKINIPLKQTGKSDTGRLSSDGARLRMTQ